MTGTPPRLPFHVRCEMFLRLLAVQGAWNYETMMGNGIAFAVEPALR
jgi:mannose/fructose/N-acetylgalactosamine-specific phosphotransferase system component IID